MNIIGQSIQRPQDKNVNTCFEHLSWTSALEAEAMPPPKRPSFATTWRARERGPEETNDVERRHRGCCRDTNTNTARRAAVAAARPSGMVRSTSGPEPDARESYIFSSNLECRISLGKRLRHGSRHVAHARRFLCNLHSERMGYGRALLFAAILLGVVPHAACVLVNNALCHLGPLTCARACAHD